MLETFIVLSVIIWYIVVVNVSRIVIDIEESKRPELYTFFLLVGMLVFTTAYLLTFKYLIGLGII